MDGKSSFNICTCFTNSSSSSSLSNWLNEILISEEGNLILYFYKYISQTIFQPQKEKETRSITVTISLLLLIDIIFFIRGARGRGQMLLWLRMSIYWKIQLIKRKKRIIIIASFFCSFRLVSLKRKKRKRSK